ncbi:MAG TPA: type II secretion system protein, partial [Phycisphaerae bacterium]|nr:type II secretion system protein [Phycisphaerae bacterium]
MKFFIKKNRGFTLIELLIGIIMTAMLMSAISIVIATGMKGYEISNNATEQTQLIRNTLERISREIRSADEVTWNGTTLVINPGSSQ